MALLYDSRALGVDHNSSIGSQKKASYVIFNIVGLLMAILMILILDY